MRDGRPQKGASRNDAPYAATRQVLHSQPKRIRSGIVQESQANLCDDGLDNHDPTEHRGQDI